MSRADRPTENRRRDRREESRRRVLRRRRALAIASIALVLIAIIWLIGSCGGDDGPKPPAGPTPEEIQAEEERKAAAKRDREDRAIQKVLTYTDSISEGGGTKRQVALTFDDGPSPYTDRILDTLKRHNASATFFVLGAQVAEHEPSLLRAAEEGHAIASHSQTHPMMGSMDVAGQAAELDAQLQAVTSAGVEQYKLFRPPYRSFNQGTFDLLKERKELMVLWSVDTDDYSNPGSQAIADRVLNEAKPGSIILMHDGGGDRNATADALPAILKGLKQRRLKPVTVPRMLVTDPPQRNTEENSTIP